MVEITKAGTIVARSRNLRGILDYARKSYVCSARITSTTEGASLYIMFNDGAECRTPFASFSVCVGFVQSRRTWQEHLQRVDCSRDMVSWFVPSSHAYGAIR